jgi:hypothetical protein
MDRKGDERGIGEEYERRRGGKGTRKRKGVRAEPT